jgi:hypothetical protein
MQPKAVGAVFNRDQGLLGGSFRLARRVIARNPRRRRFFET